MKWLRLRLRSLLPLRSVLRAPWERKILQALAALRDVTTFLAAFGAFHAAETYISALRWPLALAAAILWSIFYADFLRNRLLKRLLGYSYNPNVTCINEWEGGMCPTREAHFAEWRAKLMIRDPWATWHGDPGSGRWGDE